LGQPEEIAEIAVMLAGDKASYLTGQVITVDRGATLACEGESVRIHCSGLFPWGRDTDEYSRVI
jgi:hypothetical protein